MKPMFLCSLLCLLTMAFGAESAASQVTRADYERADTIDPEMLRPGLFSCYPSRMDRQFTLFLV